MHAEHQVQSVCHTHAAVCFFLFFYEYKFQSVVNAVCVYVGPGLGHLQSVGSSHQD